MIDELNTAIGNYYQQWQELVAKRKNKAFFASLKSTSVGWKTVDLADFDKRFAELREHCDQIHFGLVNNRWIATLHLQGQPLAHGLTVIKLMQRRPGSTDPTGLDHLDFLLPQESQPKEILGNEPDMRWTEEKNGDHCKWLSIWFGKTEAKLRSDTVIDVCVAEMQEVGDALLKVARA